MAAVNDELLRRQVEFSDPAVAFVGAANAHKQAAAAAAALAAARGAGSWQRAVGIVEQLRPAEGLGYIRCYPPAEARLMFRYSDTSCQANLLRVGEPCEFAYSPAVPSLATSVRPLPQQRQQQQHQQQQQQQMQLQHVHINPMQLDGTVLIGCQAGNPSQLGRLCYIVSGEHFYLQFSASDVQPRGWLPAQGDQVQFRMATVPGTMMCWAVDVCRPGDMAAGKPAAADEAKTKSPTIINKPQPKPQPAKQTKQQQQQPQQQQQQEASIEPRPQRLRHRLKTQSEEAKGPRIVLCRQPLRPANDNHIGFTRIRQLWPAELTA